MIATDRERLRILLVDDSGDDRAAARMALRSSTVRRYDIDERGTGAAAMDRLCTPGNRYDCCVVDYHLPDMDAVGFITLVRAQTSVTQRLDALPIVVLTGSAGDEVNRSVLRAGAQDFVGKDWLSAESLNRAVDNAIERQAMSQELRARNAELKASERRLRQVIDSMHVHVAMIAPDGRVIESNAMPSRRGPASSSGEHVWDGEQWGHTPDVRARLADAFGSAARTGRGVRYDEWMRPGGGAAAAALYDVSIEPVSDDAGRVLFVVLSGVDVTQRRVAEEERERLLDSERLARGEAERANRLKDEFLATLSHELRTPLNAILGWAQMLRIGKLGGDSVRRGLETIERNAKAQAQLIEDLLDMSRILSGKLRLDARRLVLAELVEASISTILPSAEAKGVAIHRLLEGHPSEVQGDPSRIQQIIWNLLSNAVKFTPAGGRIDVSLKRVGDALEVSIADSGQGISPDFVGHVFERFRQADSSTTREHGGLGLGLAIVKHLAELHGGTIAARSGGLGSGSTFALTLPSSPRSIDATPLHPESSRASAGAVVIDSPLRSTLSEFDLTGIRVLAVDDDADAREVASRVLAECGATVETSSSVEEAIRHLGRPFDVLITDIGMPGRDGYELIRYVRGREADGTRPLPTIAMTAFASAEDRRRVLREGFNSHLVKPVDPAELCGVVAALVGRAPA